MRNPSVEPDDLIHQRRRTWREILTFGLACGVLLTVLRLLEHRLLGVAHSAEIWSVIVAFLFAGVGLWLGAKLRGRAPTGIPGQGQGQGQGEVSAAFVADEARRVELGVTARELEILGLIAEGLSNREIATRLFVSENTVKTHSSRLFDKLGASRRTQAVRLGKAAGLLP